MMLDAENVGLHKIYHDLHRGLTLPGHVRDAIRRWASDVMQNSVDMSDPSQKFLALTAIDTMRHMWWHRDYRRGTSQEEAFEVYNKELRMRYPKMRPLL